MMKYVRYTGKTLHLVSVLLLLSILLGTTASADITAAFVDIGYGARPMGMGGAFTALSDDAHAIFWNPAGQTLMERSQLAMMHTKQFGLIPYSLGAYSSHIKKNHIGVAYLTSGNDALKENTVFASYARAFQLPLLGLTRVGLNLRYRSASFGNNEDGGEERSKGTATGFGFDLGILWKLDQATQFGIFGRDLINNMNYNNKTRQVEYAEKIPAALIFGLSRQFGKAAVFAIDWDKSLHEDTTEKVHIGGEVTLFKILMLRAGLWQNMDTYRNLNYSLGFGLQIIKHKLGAQFDFAYIFNDLANTPRISLSIYH